MVTLCFLLPHVTKTFLSSLFYLDCEKAAEHTLPSARVLSLLHMKITLFYPSSVLSGGCLRAIPPYNHF